MSSVEPLPIVFTAQSKHFYFCRDAVCEFVFRMGYLPVNPFRAFAYFLDDRVDRDLVRRANNNLVRIADELWVFGDIADGVLSEIRYASELGKPIRFFSIATRADEIRALTSVEEIRIEPEVLADGLTRDGLVADLLGGLFSQR